MFLPVLMSPLNLVMFDDTDHLAGPEVAVKMQGLLKKELMDATTDTSYQACRVKIEQMVGKMVKQRVKMTGKQEPQMSKE